MCPWRIIHRNTEKEDDVYENKTHTDQCCLPVIKYKNFLSGSDISTEISFHSTKYTAGLNLKLRVFSLLTFTRYSKPLVHFQPPHMSQSYFHHTSDLRNTFFPFTSYYRWLVQSPPNHRCFPLTIMSLSPHDTE